MKNIIISILVLLAGVVLGFFGTLNSVFSDGANSERIITIAIVLIIYFILGGISSLILPKKWRQWSILLAAPGVILLVVYMIKDYSSYYFVYMLLILVMSYLGARTGSAIRKNSSI